MRLEEENLRKGNHVRLEGEFRKKKNPGVLFDKSQKIFFIFIGEMFPHQQVGVFVIGIVEVGHV